MFLQKLRNSEKKYYIFVRCIIKKILIKTISCWKIIDLRDIVSLCKIKDLLRFIVKFIYEY